AHHLPGRGRARGDEGRVGEGMSAEAIVGLYVFILAIFVGFEVISKVPSTLHTPLMSGANAIHGIIVIGAMLVSAAIGGPLGLALGFFRGGLGGGNVGGGFAR